MNHDYAHCLDYTKDCPKKCFRAELQRDIEENRSEFVGVPLTYAHLRGEEECELAKDTDVSDRKVWKWIDAEKAPFDMWYATCSECGKRQTLEYLNYCPNCGARMEGEEDE